MAKTTFWDIIERTIEKVATPLSAKEISALCRLGTSQVWRYLDRMKLAGKVKNISSVSKQGKQKIWSVASPQNNPCEEVKKLIP